jgi:hypothetical protein
MGARCFPVKVVLSFAVVVSLLSLPGLSSNGFRFPTIPEALAIPAPCPTHGSGGVCSEYWYPAGAAMDLFQGTILGSSCEYVELTGGICGCPDCTQSLPLIDLPDSPAPSNTLGSFNSSSAYYLTAPIGGSQFAYLSNWQRVVNDQVSSIPNFFTWLDAHSSNPGTPGTIRQGLAIAGTGLSPYIMSTVTDEFIDGNIYDSLDNVNPLSSNQLLDWMVLSSSPSSIPNSQLTYVPPAGTVGSFRFSLRTDLFFQDGRKVSSFDIAFSYLSLKATGAFQASSTSSMMGVTLLSPTQFDLNLNTTSALVKSSLTSLTVMPGRYWTNAGLPAWDAGVSVCSQSLAPCYPSQYTLGPTPSSGLPAVQCSFQCAFPASNMDVDPAKTTTTFDPLSAGILIGSGPWECLSSIGIVGTGCSSSGTQTPSPFGGSYALTRFGKGLPPATSVAGDYFRSSGNLALWLWSGDNGDLTHDFLNFSHAAFCYLNPSPTCHPLTEGIGAVSGGGLAGLAQVAIVARFVGVNWISPFSLANPPIGMGPFPPVLYEGSQTLNPASVAGCLLQYPVGGYDC